MLRHLAKMADESTPLLQSADTDVTSDPPPKRSVLSQALEEMKTLARISLPASLGYAVQNSIQTVSIAIVGKSDGSDLELSASAHAFMIAMVTAWVIALGGTTALDTLGSTAFARSQAIKRSEGESKRQIVAAKELGILLQRTVIILLLLYIPFCLLWVFIEGVLIKLGQPADVAHAVQVFLRRLAFGAPGYILFEAGKKYCIIQNSNAPTVIIIITAVINVFLNLFFVKWLGWGIKGCAIAVSITYYLSVAGLIIYVAMSRSLRSAWGGIDVAQSMQWSGLKRVVQLAIPGVLMIGSEWIAFEIIALAAGNLDKTSLAAQSVIMTFDQVLNTIPFGLGVATTTRIGKLLGEESSDKHATPSSSSRRLRIAAQSATMFATILGSLIGLTLFVLRRSFGYLFSSESTTVALVAKVIPLVATFQVFDGWVAANGGALRGVGKQKIGAIINLASYYALALPLGIYLAFWKDKGLKGLWLGNTLALGLVGFSEWLYVTSLRWPKEIEKVVLQQEHHDTDHAQSAYGAIAHSH
jgi:MATE family multidrug resistance protein